jgi:hypothetical protein
MLSVQVLCTAGATWPASRVDDVSPCSLSRRPKKRKKRFVFGTTIRKASLRRTSGPLVSHLTGIFTGIPPVTSAKTGRGGSDNGWKLTEKKPLTSPSRTANRAMPVVRLL